MHGDIESVLGVVLAGGRSERMGSPKALLRCGSKTFLDTLADGLVLGGCRPVVAVISEPIRMAVLKECRLEGIEVVVNPNPELGPISSLRCALGVHPQTSGVIWVLVDQGRVGVDTIRSTREALKKYDTVVTRYRSVAGHPTGFSKKIFARLFSPEADQGARGIVDQEQGSDRVGYLDVDDPAVIRNINTRRQYEEFVRGLRG